jgi:hypothetical protein
MLIGSSVITARSLVSLWIVDSASGYADHCEYITNGLSTKGDPSAWKLAEEPKTPRSERSSVFVEKDIDWNKAWMHIFLSIVSLNKKAVSHLAGSTLCYATFHPPPHTHSGWQSRQDFVLKIWWEEVKVKVKFILEQATKAQRGSKGITSALDWSWWSTPRSCRFTHGKDPIPIV